MLADIETITDEEIAYSEKVLLKPGGSFDDERRAFIKNLETRDLLAVPGSGKTTALLAKLLILDKRLPFKDGSGILVLSHTNAAIDEIKNRLSTHCHNLFSSPSFVGTIQSFADHFFAIPFYSTLGLADRIYRIDDEIYYEKAKIFLNTPAKDWLKVLVDMYLLGKLNSLVVEDDHLVDFWTGTTFTRVNFKPEHGLYKMMCSVKTRLLSNGYLCYNDAYYLARKYLESIPKIKKLLQKRFQFVFVDEMQDMDWHQCELLEMVFSDFADHSCTYQRIGDPSQAIYNREPKDENIWQTRKPLTITGSHRLSKAIARVVEPLAIVPIKIEGTATNVDGSEISIPPIFIEYDDNSIKDVIKCYACLIGKYVNAGQIPDPKGSFYAVAWNTIWNDEQKDPKKLRLVDFYENYSSQENKPRIDFETLESYLKFHDKTDGTLKGIQRNIFCIFLKVLRLEKIRHDENSTGKDREFKRRSLVRYMRDNFDSEVIEGFKRNLFKWSFEVAKGDHAIVLREIREYLPTFLSNFQNPTDNKPAKVELSVDFIASPCPYSFEEDEDDIESKQELSDNYYLHDGIRIKLGTVHSVKGQTHTATLYLESYYYDFDLNRLADQLNLRPLTGKEKSIVRQSAKMAYVGFSRPTHLLCVAIHADRLKVFRDKIPPDTWEIVKA